MSAYHRQFEVELTVGCAVFTIKIWAYGDADAEERAIQWAKRHFRIGLNSEVSATCRGLA